MSSAPDKRLIFRPSEARELQKLSSLCGAEGGEGPEGLMGLRELGPIKRSESIQPKYHSQVA